MRWTPLLWPAAVLALQIPLQAGQIAFEDLAASDLVSIYSQTDSRFLHVLHKAFPGHSLRIRQPKLHCDDVKQFSGYLDTPSGRHFYFYLYESRHDPVKDPVQLWLNGGPGCSSFTGMLMENGPCQVKQDDKDSPVTLERNPFAWNSNATLIYLDQPVGVGYSYADPGISIGTTEDAAIDVHAFLTILFEAFNRKFGSSDFHMSGESFAGRYIPVFADYIIQQNQNPAVQRKINLKSILVGNGFTHPTVQYSSYWPTVCTNVSGYGPFVNTSTCHQMLLDLPRCQELTLACAANVSDTQTCIQAAKFCEKTQADPFYATGRNAYDMAKFGDYAQEKQIHSFLNRDDVRHQLGVDREPSGGVRHFIGCSDKVGNAFEHTGDGAKPSWPHVVNLLESGIRTLFYSGDRDFICNWLGNEAWTFQLDWSGQKDFQKEPLQFWKHEGKHAGLYRTFGNLTFATVAGSGHFVPTDQPANSLALATYWVHGGSPLVGTPGV